MLRQETVDYIRKRLNEAHSQRAIREELSRKYSEEDINDAFEAISGASHGYTMRHHSHNLGARLILFLVIAIVIGAVLGLGTYGLFKLKNKLALIEQTKDTAPANPTAGQTNLPAAGDTSSANNGGIADASGTAIQNPSATGMALCASYQDQKSDIAKTCRQTEARKLSDAKDCNKFSDIPTYEACSRAFYEIAVGQ